MVSERLSKSRQNAVYVFRTGLVTTPPSSQLLTLPPTSSFCPPKTGFRPSKRCGSIMLVSVVVRALRTATFATPVASRTTRLAFRRTQKCYDWLMRTISPDPALSFSRLQEAVDIICQPHLLIHSSSMFPMLWTKHISKPSLLYNVIESSASKNTNPLLVFRSRVFHCHDLLVPCNKRCDSRILSVTFPLCFRI